MAYPINWNLDRIFPGGIDSPQLKQRLSELATALPAFTTAVNVWQFETDQPTFAGFSALLTESERLQKGIATAGTFANMILSADAKNQQVGPVLSQIADLDTTYQAAMTPLVKKLVALTADQFAQLIAVPSFAEIRFNLSEIRQQGQELLDDATEALITALAIDGYNGWSQHYDTLSANLSFDVDLPDGPVQLSAGQAQNRFESDLDADNRAKVFNVWEQTWQANAPIFADTLNHLAGFRLTNYRAHHQSDYMAKPLELNRMQPSTLNQMWSTVSANKGPFVAYLQQKAKLLGHTSMPWQDQWAPVVVGDFTPKIYTFDEAAEFIITNFKKFSPKMADFAQQAFEHGWIEAEDRPGKRPGGYMTSVPDIKEGRIFMTFDGSASGVSTLAHELGHAFHSSLLEDLPALRQDYAMNVAETASTFAELIVASATVEAASSPEEKLNLLDTKMSNPIAMLLNIHARYLFERKFYDARQHGTVTVPALQSMMQAAQEEAYAGGITSFDPMYWADKLHFFIDDVPFYNFPYTFGYLFSSGIYAKAQTTPNFEDQYIALLIDTANMSTEDLAKKHLGVDLSQPAFWQQGIDLAAKDGQAFIDLSQKYLK
ncbi:M3 family oligoendopeptidase [Lacticaseibacillus brantae]|uniref:M3B subfamily peptidase n=1 Tax=Lacticaseibacillus brantae DSM 23927 TaxID=1423727 RepID=A0A0R2BA67_9LACO|nr:M3 family oligoendopeptidase [Lacticaseibacillus brantae]KRM73062.1 M3B subfamily peptidase [Lacticaseibacillus brantae DSM 23927]